MIAKIHPRLVEVGAFFLKLVKLELVNKLNYPYGIEVFKEFLIDGKAPKAEKIFNDISKQIQDANLK